MPIIVKWRGAEIQCDTPEQAIAITSGLDAQRPQLPVRITRTRPITVPHSIPPDIVRLFASYDGKVLNADQMSDILELESPNGVGVKLRHMREQFRADGIDLDQYIKTIRQSDGTTNWSIELAQPNPFA